MSSIIDNTIAFVKTNSSQEGAHDEHHVLRVWNTAKIIAQEEKGDLLVIELAALLHDVDDWKFEDDKERTKTFLDTVDLPNEKKEHILTIIEQISFKGAGVKTTPSTIEGKIVQDADRLDAIGAIGIARCFAYGGFKGNKLHDPHEHPKQHESFEDYKENSNNSFNHFYEKLLLLKDLMNTEKGKELAEGRHTFMEQFLEQFEKEVHR